MMTPFKQYNTSYAENDLWYCLILFADFMTTFLSTWNFVIETSIKTKRKRKPCISFKQEPAVISVAISSYPGEHLLHYSDVIMGAIASQITSLTIVYSTVYSDADQRKHQSSASLAFVRGIHQDRWIPRTNGQLRGKCFHLMTSSWIYCNINDTLWFHQWRQIIWQHNNSPLEVSDPSRTMRNMFQIWHIHTEVRTFSSQLQNHESSTKWLFWSQIIFSNPHPLYTW